MMQAENTRSNIVQPVDQAVPVAVPVAAVAAPNRSLTSVPVIGGLCCIGLVLFLIATTIVLSLIPVYTSGHDVTPTLQQKTVTFNVLLSNGTVVTVGPFNANQRLLLQADLQSRLNSNPQTSGATITVDSATAVSKNRRKRRASTTDTISVTGTIEAPRRLNLLQIILAILFDVTLDDSDAQALENASDNAGIETTTTSTSNSTSGNQTLSLVRRSLEEGGAPAGIVYIDSRQVAASTGNVNSVSFYVDRTCALATIEFGAFDLLNRNVDENTAELVLTQRSGPFKLDAASELKPYMNMITIRLCGANAVDNTNSEGCKGHQFPVLPHQYLGIRSDKCRFGFARAPINHVLATTWKISDDSDPFAEPYKKLNYVPSDYTVLQSVVIDSTETKNNLPVNEQKSVMKNGPRVLFIGTFPPRRCGLAKFLEDLTDSYPGPHSVIAVDEQGADSSNRSYPDKVILRLNQTNRDAYYTVANIANSEAYDVLNVQHEYALYGGMVGEYIINLLGATRKPVITTMHTIVPDPNAYYLSVTRAICATSTRVIVLSDLGRRILVDVYGIDERKISVIPHGVPDVAYTHSLSDAKTKVGIKADIPMMTTFGLLNRNKNIQFALKAMKTVVKSVPNVMYLVIGQTHPLVQSSEGESYRRELEGNVTALGLSKNVLFIDKYVDDNELLAYLGATDIYLTPYAQENQYVSGTLSWAVGLGKAVVSTPYLYAKELLADGRGFLVPFEDHQFLGSTITKLLKDDNMRNEVRRHAYKYGRKMVWPHVAKELETLCRELLLFN